MPQTLLALAAVVVFSLVAFNQQRADNDVETDAISLAADLAAADLAEERMAEVLLAHAWDEEDTGWTVLRTAPPSSGIGPDNNADGNETGPADFDDIDDFDGLMTTYDRPAGTGTLAFRDSVSVVFVDPAAPDSETPSPTPTLAKRVEVFVAEVGAQGRRGATVRLRRVATSADHAPHRR